jgi:hypothetical protein
LMISPSRQAAKFCLLIFKLSPFSLKLCDFATLRDFYSLHNF